MKKFLLSTLFVMAACVGAKAMSYDRAQEEALYLTDKMAYELNLNDQQYNDAYEINLDYFLCMETEADLRADYYRYRLADMRCILHDWQYDLMLAADYFIRPLIWRAGGWYFPIYTHYTRGFFYYSRPTVWGVYRGGHGRFHYSGGFYVQRRPVWNGGFRGHDMHRAVPGMGHRATPGISHRGTVGSRPVSGRGISGPGYHVDLGGSRREGSYRGGSTGSSDYRGTQSGRPGNSDYSGQSGRPGNSGYSGQPNRQGNSGYSGQPGNSGARAEQGGGTSARPSSSYSGSRGNSFDGSSSRMGGASRGSSMSGGASRSGFSGGASRGSSMSGASRGGGFNGGGSMGGASRGGGFGGGASHGAGGHGGRR